MDGRGNPGQIQRGEIARQTQQEIARIDKEIVEHRQNTNAEINNDMFLTLTGQEDYVNPFTNEVERDTGEWKYRWTDPSGIRVFSNEAAFDPNHDSTSIGAASSGRPSGSAEEGDVGALDPGDLEVNSVRMRADAVAAWLAGGKR